jgi:hypothetical protein
MVGYAPCCVDDFGGINNVKRMANGYASPQLNHRHVIPANGRNLSPVQGERFLAPKTPLGQTCGGIDDKSVQVDDHQDLGCP